MTNAELLEAYKNKKKYVKLLQQIDKSIQTMWESRGKLANKVHEINKISQIYKGVPIGTGPNKNYFRSLDNQYRSAEIYINCHNNTTWGVYLSSSTGNVHDSKCIGNQFTRRQALRIAKDWVALGIKHNN